MGDTPPQPEWHRGALGTLRERYRAALAAGDLRGSRELVAAAARDGHPLGRIYVDVVRPALERDGAGLADGAAARLAIASAEASLAAVASRPAEGSAMRGHGRRALVSVGPAPLDALDGEVIVDTLCRDGWSVDEFAAGSPPEEVAASARAGHVQLVVMPTSNAADLLASAHAYTLLRRLPDPPVIVACSLGRPDETRRARAAGADAFAPDPDALLEILERRLPASAVRNWGVRLARRGATLVLAPTGDLDESSVSRLREVAGSRDGSFDSLVIDTREVATVSATGRDALVAWLRGARYAGGRLRVLPGPLLDCAAGAPLEPGWLAAPADAGA